MPLDLLNQDPKDVEIKAGSLSEFCTVMYDQDQPVRFNDSRFPVLVSLRFTCTLTATQAEHCDHKICITHIMIARVCDV